MGFVFHIHIIPFYTFFFSLFCNTVKKLDNQEHYKFTLISCNSLFFPLDNKRKILEECNVLNILPQNYSVDLPPPDPSISNKITYK